MLLKRFAFLATVALAAAAPGKSKTCGAKKPDPSLPVNGGDRELPDPPAGTKLRHVVLGHGYQNYTCTKAEDSDDAFTSKATGALAVLYDARPFFPDQSRHSLTFEGVMDLPEEAAHHHSVPLNIDESITEGRIEGSAPAVVVSDPWIEPANLKLEGAGRPLKHCGLHYFDGQGVPVFDLGKDKFLARKTDEVNAPAVAPTGPDSGKAVKWLMMEDAGGSVNIKYVYRVNTVGGSGHVCTEEGDDSAVYATYYYLYG